MAMYCLTESRQFGKQQDHAFYGKYSKGYYVGVLDGHGTNRCIDLLRKVNYNTLIEMPDPCNELFHYLSPEPLYGTGSTINFNKIEISDKIYITNYNIGDSETMILVNGEVVFSTNPHTLSNESEKIRIQPYLSPIQSVVGWTPIPITDKRMSAIRSDISKFATGESLVPTQSLGHDNMTGYAPDVSTITCELSDKVRIICGTDGFWNMIVKSLDMDDLKQMPVYQLMDKAEKRWKQEWEYAPNIKNLNQFELTTFPDYDDITLGIWDNSFEV